jgi:hypothetical protein
MIRKHYGAWVPERQERLTRILREAFEDKPTPKLVAIRSPALSRRVCIRRAADSGTL